MIYSQGPDFLEAQEELKKSMQNEVTIMREILSNLLQEEVSLIQHDKTFWVYLMQNRFFMIEQVREFRVNRINATEKLIALSEEKTLEKISWSEKETICEIPLLLDQLITLSEKINTQNIRNQILSESTQHLVAIPNYISYPKPETSKVRKTFLMTMEENS